MTDKTVLVYIDPEKKAAGADFRQPSGTDSGYDICTPANIVFGPIGTDDAIQRIETGIHIQLQFENYFTLIANKSSRGVGRKNDKYNVWRGGGLLVLGGVIDPGYTGELVIGMINLSNATVEIQAGEKIAQAIVLNYQQPAVKVVEELNNFSHTLRGGGGFGSTGLK